MRQSITAWILIALLLVGAGLTGGATPATSTVYYLALGDDLALGYQPNHNLSHGYVTALYAQLRHTTPRLQLINLACAGETAATMLGRDGSYCSNWKTTEGRSKTPQLAQALAFLRAHRGAVRLVTLDMGANDLLELIANPPFPLAVPSIMDDLSNSLDSILAQLRAAAGSHVPIITMTYYDVYVTGAAHPIREKQLLKLDAAIKADAAQHDVQVAPVYEAFSHGDAARTVCAWTWYCSSAYPETLFPTSAGYAAIARAFVQSGAH